MVYDAYTHRDNYSQSGIGETTVLFPESPLLVYSNRNEVEPRDMRALQPTQIQHLILIVVGVILGGIVCFPFLYYFVLRDNGTHYSTLSELQEVLSKEAPTRGSSTSLRALIKSDPSKEIIYTLKPDLNVIFQKVPVRTNSFGMRGEEVTLEKPFDTYRVALLGDSFAFGWGVKEEEIFAHILETELHKLLQRNVEVLNFGVPGYSTFQEYAHYAEYGARFSPDAILVYFVENDWGLPYFLGNSAPGNPLMTAVDFARQVWNKKTEEAAQERSFYYSIMNPNLALAKLAAFAKERDQLLFVAVNPGRAWKSDVQRLNVLRNTPNLFHISLMDPVAKRIQERQFTNEELKLPDDPHPSAIKHRLLGEVLAEEMGKKIVK